MGPHTDARRRRGDFNVGRVPVLNNPLTQTRGGGGEIQRRSSSCSQQPPHTDARRRRGDSTSIECLFSTTPLPRLLVYLRGDIGVHLPQHLNRVVHVSEGGHVVAAQVEIESKTLMWFACQFQTLGFRRFQCGLDRVNLHRPTMCWLPNCSHRVVGWSGMFTRI